jgi:hypothetical protein
VGVLSCSKPMQPVAAIADNDSTAIRMRFFILSVSDGRPANFARPVSQGEEEVYQRVAALIASFCG